MHFFVTYKCTVDTDRITRTTVHVQHVTHTEQRFSTHLVQNGSAVNFAADLESDTRWNIRLDQTGDHINARALRGQYQMDACSARFLRQACDELFNLFTDHHHQVGQFVDHHHDVR